MAPLNIVQRMAAKHVNVQVSHGDAGFGFGMRALYRNATALSGELFRRTVLR